MNIKTIEYKLKEGDTIEGILKGKSKLDLENAKDLFYQINGNKIFKVGDTVKIPIEITEE